LIAAFILSAVILFRVAPKGDNKLLAIFFLAFNPIFTFFFIVGYNDIFVYGWLLLTWYLLWRKRYGWSAFILGLALLSKQSAWLVTPFYFFYFYYQLPAAQQWLNRAWQVIKKLWPAYLAVVLFALPFIIWAPSNLYSDVISYAAGTSEHRFPVYGEGFAQILLQAGVIQSMWDRYPFWIFQTIVGLPLLFFLLWWQKNDNTIARLIISYTIFLAVFWLFSRYFNPNYVGFITLTMLAAWAFHQREVQTRHDRS
jgi:hypothetical protein